MEKNIRDKCARILNGSSILITGGTGSFGKVFTKIVLENFKPSRLIIFSRDELKQHQMREQFPESKDSPIRYFIGDVRDKDRLYRAFDGVDYVVHAAALKHVPVAEYNPLEAIKTNVYGTANVIDMAIDRNVKKVIALSTDKACNPVNLYGATKLCADKLVSAARTYSGAHKTKFSVVRYGNVVGSRGSVIPFFLKMRESHKIPITDKEMTRFWITLEQCSQFVLGCLDIMHGGEIFVPKIPSMKIVDMASAIAPKCKHEIIGIRPGEKLHEVLISEDDAYRTLEFDKYFIIVPYRHMHLKEERYKDAKTCATGFEYKSNTNTEWLDAMQIQEIVATIKQKKD